MNFRFDAVLEQPCSQVITPHMTHPEDMENVEFIVAAARQSALVGRHLAKVTQLHPQQNRLHFIQMRIRPHVVIDVLLRGAVITGMTQAIDEIVVVITAPASPIAPRFLVG
jgi:hypothetical protein